MTLIKWWKGTDAYKLKNMPKHYNIGKRLTVYAYRLLWKYFLFGIVDENWVVHGRLRKYLPVKAKVKPEYPKYMLINKKNLHKVVILYYRPKPNRNLFGSNRKFKDWLYGIDIIQQVKKEMNNVYWVEVDGNYDMREIYPFVDCYIRPNRHDGLPRMILECKRYNIPYYWDQNFQPNKDDIIEFIWKIKNEKVSNV